MKQCRVGALRGFAAAALALAALGWGAGQLPATAQSFFVDDAEEQFRRITRRAEALGFGIGDSINPDLCRHYQGLARSNGPGRPYFFIAKSGNKPESVPACLQVCDVRGVPVPCSSVGDGPGQLLVVRMGSRDTSGERLRSNRIRIPGCLKVPAVDDVHRAFGAHDRDLGRRPGHDHICAQMT